MDVDCKNGTFTTKKPKVRLDKVLVLIQYDHCNEKEDNISEKLIEWLVKENWIQCRKSVLSVVKLFRSETRYNSKIDYIKVIEL